MRLAEIRHRIVTAAAAIGAEVLAAVALVIGWTLLTIAVADYARPRTVWLVSIGLFCLSCFGWAPLVILARYGLYKATRPESKRGVSA